MIQHIQKQADPATILAAARAAGLAIPPAWPLAATVAVNPYLGQTGRDLAGTAALLARVAGQPVTMARDWYNARIASGEITDADIAGALEASRSPLRPRSIVELKAAFQVPVTAPAPLPTVADLAARVSGIDWPAIIAERFGAWAAHYADDGPALWAAPRGGHAFDAWRAFATHDLAPEIAGLSGFAAFVSGLSGTASQTITRAAALMGLTAGAADGYFHRLLITLGGWSHYARHRLWQAELRGESDDTITGFLAIRLLWDQALLDRYGERIGADWRAALIRYAKPITPNRDQVIDAIMQDASERGVQRRLDERLRAASGDAAPATIALQAAFCIDVRSEVFRRALEAVDPAIRTLGFAGFFGLATAHRPFAADTVEHRLPVLLNPGSHSCSGDASGHAADLSARFKARAVRAWGRFKLAAVSSFAFVEASGPAYIVKLARDALGVGGTRLAADPAPRFDPPLDLTTRIATAAKVLRAMSLTRDFAPIVLLVGHGATVTNNPHASALHCGACGGHKGDVNARLLAALLNDADVRAGLAEADILIPSSTRFVAALHDTTTDAVTLFADGEAPAALEQVRLWLAAAGERARAERAKRLPRARGPQDILRRSRDWAETRPEWGLAGCNAFIAAPRRRTAGVDLGGRAFLHDYDWRADQGFAVLELIMTAPVVVASWISLQYYGSTVSPDLFGGGNKLIHNVIGGIGVVEGNGGMLRVGLPRQSVEDGTAPVHEPLRLSVCIEAPTSAMSAILARHDGVRALFDSGWMHLIALGEEGGMVARYAGDLQWVALGNAAKETLAA